MTGATGDRERAGSGAAVEATAAVARELRGWGAVAPSRAAVLAVRRSSQVAEELRGANADAGGVIARGAGRSYGDAAQNAGGRVLDMTSLTAIRAIDAEAGTVTVEAGATLGSLLAVLAACGLTLPVVPGTRLATVGGAIASDIHGKNHVARGSFARGTLSIDLQTPAGEHIGLTPERDGELFWATCGGMGLTGVISQATLRAEALVAPWLLSDVDRTRSLDDTLSLLHAHQDSEHLIAWIDMLAPGVSFGRGLVHRIRAWPAEVAAPAEPRAWSPRHPAALAQEPALSVPRGLPAALLRPLTARAYNLAHWRATPRHREHAVPLVAAYFPLDVVGDWYRLYGASGFYQYQFVVPAAQEQAMVRALELLRDRGVPVYLAVIKRFGAATDGPLSFPIPGWTAALDLPAGADGVDAALDELDELVAAAGGRVYLTKDARLRPELLAAMYPRLADFETVRARVDPRGAMRSDLGRRLGLCAP